MKHCENLIVLKEFLLWEDFCFFNYSGKGVKEK